MTVKIVLTVNVKTRMITPGISLKEKTITIGEAVCTLGEAVCIIDTLIIGGRKNTVSGKQCNNFSKC